MRGDCHACSGARSARAQSVPLAGNGVSTATWHALAYKGPADVELALDQSGHITEHAHQ